MKATVYGTPKCSWCNRVSKMLGENEIDVEKIVGSGYKVLIKEMQKAAGKK